MRRFLHVPPRRTHRSLSRSIVTIANCRTRSCGRIVVGLEQGSARLEIHSKRNYSQDAFVDAMAASNASNEDAKNIFTSRTSFKYTSSSEVEPSEVTETMKSDTTRLPAHELNSFAISPKSQKDSTYGQSSNQTWAQLSRLIQQRKATKTGRPPKYATETKAKRRLQDIEDSRETFLPHVSSVKRNHRRSKEEEDNEQEMGNRKSKRRPSRQLSKEEQKERLNMWRGKFVGMMTESQETEQMEGNRGSKGKINKKTLLNKTFSAPYKQLSNATTNGKTSSTFSSAVDSPSRNDSRSHPSDPYVSSSPIASTSKLASSTIPDSFTLNSQRTLPSHPSPFTDTHSDPDSNGSSRLPPPPNPHFRPVPNSIAPTQPISSSPTSESIPMTLHFPLTQNVESLTESVKLLANVVQRMDDRLNKFTKLVQSVPPLPRTQVKNDSSMHQNLSKLSKTSEESRSSRKPEKKIEDTDQPESSIFSSRGNIKIAEGGSYRDGIKDMSVPPTPLMTSTGKERGSSEKFIGAFTPAFSSRTKPFTATNSTTPHLSTTPSAPQSAYDPETFVKPAQIERLGRPDFDKLPRLSHGLERCISDPGLHILKDSRSGIKNFDINENIPKMENVDWASLGGFVRPSKDERLQALLTSKPDAFDINDGKEMEVRSDSANMVNSEGVPTEGPLFVSSTSQVGGALEKIWVTINRDPPQYLHSVLSAEGGFKGSTVPFNASLYNSGMLLTVLRDVNLDGKLEGGDETEIKGKRIAYAIDSFKVESDQKLEEVEEVQWFNMLSKFGHLGEALLTTENQEFDDKHMGTPTKDGVKPVPSVYQYSRAGRLFVRSQLDSWHPELPKPAFDVKTRGVTPLRVDPMNYQDGMYYQLRSRTGELESFEKEYFDLIRNAFLKYSFQVRLGDMDGIFCAYHNAREWFGFQYIPLEEMDVATCGSTEQAQRAFELCLGTLERILLKATELFPERDVNLIFDGSGTSLKVYISPKDDDSARVLLTIDPTSYLNGRWVGKLVSYNKFAMGSTDLSGIDWQVSLQMTLMTDPEVVSSKFYETMSNGRKEHMLPPRLTKDEIEMAVEGVDDDVWVGTKEKNNRVMLLPNMNFTKKVSSHVERIRSLSAKSWQEATGVQIEEPKETEHDLFEERMMPPHLSNPQTAVEIVSEEEVVGASEEDAVVDESGTTVLEVAQDGSGPIEEGSCEDVNDKDSSNGEDSEDKKLRHFKKRSKMVTLDKRRSLKHRKKTETSKSRDVGEDSKRDQQK